MRYIYLLFALLFTLPNLYSQESLELENKQQFFIGIGKPWNPDLYKNRRNTGFVVGYQNKFSESFTYEGFLQMMTVNSFPEFSEDREQLTEFVQGQKTFEAIFNTYWQKIRTWSMGGKVHFAFVNNSKFFFSIFVGVGVYHSTSEGVILNIKSVNPSSQQVEEFDLNTSNANHLGGFYMPGISFNYNFYKEFTLGLEFNLHRNFDTDKTNELPVVPSFYGANLAAGYKF